MVDSTDRMKAFEARLAALKSKMEAGLGDRAQELRVAVEGLATDPEDARRTLRSHAHRLRGVAGTYGHDNLSELSARLEVQSMASPADAVATLALQLADLAQQVGREGQPPAELAQDKVAPARLRQCMSSARPAVEGAAGGPARILAIDDDPLTIRLLNLTLNGVGGFNTTLVESATAGLQLLKEREFDLVVTDAMMPDMNGQDFCRAARELGGRCLFLPILILSAATADELGWTRADSGHTGWLRKPFRPSELVTQLSEFLANASA